MSKVSQEVLDACDIAEMAVTPLEKIAALNGVQTHSAVDVAYIDYRVGFWHHRSDPTNGAAMENLVEARKTFNRLDAGVSVKKAKCDHEPTWEWLWKALYRSEDPSTQAQKPVNEPSSSSSPPGELRAQQPLSHSLLPASASKVCQEVYDACDIAEMAVTPLEKITALLGVQARSAVDVAYVDVRVCEWRLQSDPTDGDLKKNLAEARVRLNRLDPIKKAKNDNEPAWEWLWKAMYRSEDPSAQSQKPVNELASSSSSSPAPVATKLRRRQPHSDLLETD